jgi:hypothetical protein
MADHVDKRSETQFPDINKHEMPEGVDWSWTSEWQDEFMSNMEKEHKKGK